MSSPPGRPSLVDRLLTRLGAGDLGRKLASGATWIFGQKVYFMLATLGVQILLSRTLGSERYGAYAFGLAWTQLLAVPALFGLDRLATRQIAGELALRPDATPRKFIRWSVRQTLIISLIMAALAFLAGLLLERFLSVVTPAMRNALWAGIPLVLILALLRLRQGILLGRDKASRSQLGEMVFMPTLFLAFAGIAVFLKRSELVGWMVLLVQSAAGLIAMIAIWIISRVGLPKRADEAESFEPKKWFKSGRDLVAMSLTRTANTRLDILIVGALLGASATGIYAVVNRGAAILIQSQIALSLTLSPAVVTLMKQENWQRIGRLTRKSARMGLLISAGMVLALILFGRYFLLLFGEEFVAGYSMLLILGVGQAAVSFFGQAQTLLVMSGHERDTARVLGLSLLLMVLLDVALIPLFGIIGVAWAAALTQASAAAMMNYYSWKRLGISTAVIGPQSRAS